MSIRVSSRRSPDAYSADRPVAIVRAVSNVTRPWARSGPRVVTRPRGLWPRAAEELMRAPGSCGAPLSEGAATRPCPVGETSCGRRANLSHRAGAMARPAHRGGLRLLRRRDQSGGDHARVASFLRDHTGPDRDDAGTWIEYRLRWRRMPLRWTTLIEAWEPPHRFVDSQVRGPYRLWHHTHTFSRSSPLTS